VRDIMIGANRYRRGQGALDDIGSFASRIGTRAMIVGGRTALSVASDRIERSLRGKGVSFFKRDFTTDVTEPQMRDLSEECVRERANLVICVGGGKALDCGKWAADNCNLPCITVPTSVATCACMVSLIITYNEDGSAAGGRYASSSPHVTLVDSSIIASAPARLFAAGIADTLSKWPETSYAMRNAEDDVFNGLTGYLGKSIFTVLVEKTPTVLRAIADKNVTREVEEFIDIILFLSALVGNTAGDSYRLAIAHSIHDGLIACHHELIRSFLHGEKVAYGTLVQLAVMEGFSQRRLASMSALFAEMGVPRSLSDFGLVGDDKTIRDLAAAARGPKIQAGPSETSHADIMAAIRRVEKLVGTPRLSANRRTPV
jgi:glycerol dehydrogenase